MYIIYLCNCLSLYYKEPYIFIWKKRQTCSHKYLKNTNKSFQIFHPGPLTMLHFTTLLFVDSYDLLPPQNYASPKVSDCPSPKLHPSPSPKKIQTIWLLPTTFFKALNLTRICSLQHLLTFVVIFWDMVQQPHWMSVWE